MIKCLFPAMLAIAFLSTACDHERLYETNKDLDHLIWNVDSVAHFQFTIQDNSRSYNILFNIRNTSKYPYQNIFFTYSITDSLGTKLKEELVDKLLFHQQTGEPLGSSGIGDIYDHQFDLLENYKFPHPGTYSLDFRQMMRTDTLSQVVSVGARIEYYNPETK